MIDLNTIIVSVIWTFYSTVKPKFIVTSERSFEPLIPCNSNASNLTKTKVAKMQKNKTFTTLYFPIKYRAK